MLDPRKELVRAAMDEAIAAATGATKLARLISTAEEPITVNRLCNWRDRGSVPAKFALRIERAVAQKVLSSRLCPDVFGDQAAGATCK